MKVTGYKDDMLWKHMEFEKMDIEMPNGKVWQIREGNYAPYMQYLPDKKKLKKEPKRKACCSHKRLLLDRGKGNFGIGNSLIVDPIVTCEACGVKVGLLAGEKIVNIPHYDPKHCPHTDEFHTLGIGEYLCLNCGRCEIRSPEAMLHIRSSEESSTGDMEELKFFCDVHGNPITKELERYEIGVGI